MSESLHIVQWPWKGLFRSSAGSRVGGRAETRVPFIKKIRENVLEGFLLSASVILLLLDLLKGSENASPSPPSPKTDTKHQ